MKKFDTLGDKCKFFERLKTEDRLLPGIPIYARLDGRSFSKFTKDFEKPYDPHLTAAMHATTKALIEEFKPNIGYIQSDEISLAWVNRDIDFDGKIQKLCSSLAAYASVHFNDALSYLNYSAPSLATFDCRIFNLPTPEECSLQFLWRELDATKNAISCAAQQYYSHNELMNKNSSDKQELLFQKGINFNDYPDFFKKGAYFRRQKVNKVINNVECVRTEINELIIPPLTKIANKAGVLFLEEDPILFVEGNIQCQMKS